MRKFCQFFKGFLIVALAAALFLTGCGHGPNLDDLDTHVAHEWGPWTVTTPATCTTVGKETRVCWYGNGMSHPETRSIPVNPNAHVWRQITSPTETVAGEERGDCPHNSYFTRPLCISIASLRTWLSVQPVNTANEPYDIALKLDSFGGGSGTTASLGFALNTNGTRYVSLDFSGSALTSIVNSAFSDCSSLVVVTIPDSVTAIGEEAFSGCNSLASVTIGDSVTSIGEKAFEDCRSLTSVIIPASITSIGWLAFEGCTSLASVTFEGTWSGSGFDVLGDLHAKYLVGGIGTYTTIAPVDYRSVWEKQ
ncbi:MAG: leucine-rich repeat domain-containing protein [Treponema sp.]|jgi:hypothetical protein|nr:leucine-rich repeat domain-containing protein [Treponema sp.]